LVGLVYFINTYYLPTATEISTTPAAGRAISVPVPQVAATIHSLCRLSEIYGQSLVHMFQELQIGTQRVNLVVAECLIHARQSLWEPLGAI
jgi:hypothetical protein